MNGTRSLSRVTGRKFMRGKRGLLSDSSPILLGFAGFDGKLKFLNPAWEKILGYPPQELLDRPLCELMQQHGHTAAVALVDRLLAEDSFDPMEFGLRCQDGTCKWFLWHRRFDSEHQAIFIAGYDITEQKSREIASILQSYAPVGSAARPETFDQGPSVDLAWSSSANLRSVRQCIRGVQESDRKLPSYVRQRTVVFDGDGDNCRTDRKSAAVR